MNCSLHAMNAGTRSGGRQGRLGAAGAGAAQRQLSKVWGLTQTVTGGRRAERSHDPGMSELVNI